MTTTPAQPTTAALRALAEAATPGPWNVDKTYLIDVNSASGPVAETFPEASTVEQGEADAAYIAAVDPQTVLALLDEVRERDAAALHNAHLLDTANARAERAEAIVAAARAWRERDLSGSGGPRYGAVLDDLARKVDEYNAAVDAAEAER